MRTIGQVLAGVIAMGAGAYLLAFSGQTLTLANGQSGRSWFDIIDHGIGAYFIARGLWMLTKAGRDDDLVAGVDRLVELREYEFGQTYAERAEAPEEATN